MICSKIIWYDTAMGLDNQLKAVMDEINDDNSTDPHSVRTSIGVGATTTIITITWVRN